MQLPKSYNLAIETSGRAGSVSLGRGDALLASADVDARRRHAVGLMPAIDRLCRAHDVAPADIAEAYISVGPGSFTGLRIGVTTAKMLARAVGARLVAVPTLDVIARNAPPEDHHVAVCLNAKQGRYYAGLFERDAADDLSALTEPALLTIDAILERSRRPLTVIGDHLPQPEQPEGGVTYLQGDAARARSEVVWQLGRRLAEAGAFVEPMQLTPLYVRLPEAEAVWRARHRITSE